MRCIQRLVLGTDREVLLGTVPALSDRGPLGEKMLL